jgi:hypothetical protein
MEKKLYFSKNLLVLLIGFFITSCKDSIISEHKEGWCNSTAIITQVEYDAAYGYMYTFEYGIPESTAINREGKKITGPIQQHSTDKNKPVLNQQIPIQYLKEEPIMFKLLEPIKFEHTQG